MSTLSDTAVADPIQTSADATRAAMSESIISPRFYTTDFAAMNRINVGPVRAEFDQMMAEFEGDNNQDHFQRTEDFTSQIRTLEPALQQEFLDFLISSVTSEYSGCVLYNEIRKNVDNPDIKQLMTYLTRDESRLQAEIHLLLVVPLGKNWLRALHQHSSPVRQTSRKAISPDLSLVRTLV